MERCCLTYLVLSSILFSCTNAAAQSCEDFVGTYSYLGITQLAGGDGLVAYEFRHPTRNIRVRALGANGASEEITNPWGRNVKQYLVMESFPRETTRTICVYSDHEANIDEFFLQRIDTSGLTENQEAVLLALGSISKSWATSSIDQQEEAILQATQALESVKEKDELVLELRLLHGLANAKRFNYADAKKSLQPLIEDGQLGPDNLYIALWSLGEINLREGDLSNANELLSEAVIAVDAAASQSGENLSLDKAGILSDLGESFIALGNFQEGESALNLALSLGTDSPELLSHIYNNQAFLYIRKSRDPSIEASQYSAMQDAVTEAHYRARYYAIQAGDTEAQLKAENNQAVHFLRLGETRKALAHYLNALQLTGDDQFLEIKQAITENIGSSYQSLGDYSKSLTYILESIDIAESTGSPLISHSTCILGTTQRLLGDSANAVNDHTNCALLALSQSDGELFIKALRELSADYLLQRENEKAIFTAGIARILIQGTPALLELEVVKQSVSNTLSAFSDENVSNSESFLAYASALLTTEFIDAFEVSEIADFLIDKSNTELTRAEASSLIAEDPGLGLIYLTQTLDMRTPTGNRFVPNYAQANEGSVTDRISFEIIEEELKSLETQLALSLSSQSSSAALRIIEDTLRQGYRSGSPIEEIDTLSAIANIALANGNLELAKQYSYIALDRIEELHEHLEAERLGPMWSDKTHTVFTTLIDILLEEHEVSGDGSLLSQAFSVSERSRSISLRQRLGIQFPEFLPNLEERDQIQVISSLANMRAEEESSDSQSLLVRYNQQHDLVSLSRLANIDALPVPPHQTLEQVPQLLESHQLFLNYIATRDSLYLVIISNQGYELHRLGKLADITSITNTIARELRDQNTFPIEATIALSDLVLPSLEKYQGITELIIIPDTGLHTVSFASLSAEENRYMPLISRYSIRNTTSISTFTMEKVSNHPSSTSIAVLADPIFDAEEIALQPSTEVEETNLRNWAQNRTRLPYTAIEANNLVSQFEDYPVLSFTGESATRNALTSEEVRNSKILHLATHGYFKSTSDDNVGLALSPISSEDSDDTGFITLTELFGYSFNNDLVVISGCDTSLGEELLGAGLNSLTRGFLAQGADNVISTLWPVDDRASAEFMKVFYTNLRREQTVSRALQRTQQTMLENPNYRNPFFWSGYVLSSVSQDIIQFD